MAHKTTTRIQLVPGGWLGRVIGTLVAIALLVLLFFFFTLALLAFGVLLVIVLVRIIWAARKPHEKTSPGTIEGEYLVSTQADEPAPAAQITAKDITPPPR